MKLKRYLDTYCSRGSCKSYDSFQVTKCPWMVIVVLPVSGINYFHSPKHGWMQWACLSHQPDRRDPISHLSTLCLLSKTSEIRWGSPQELIPQPQVSSQWQHLSELAQEAQQASCCKRNNVCFRNVLGHRLIYLVLAGQWQCFIPFQSKGKIGPQNSLFQSSTAYFFKP